MKIGLLAGGGKLPVYVAEAAQAKGQLGTVIGIDPSVRPSDYSDFVQLRVGQLGKAIKRLKSTNCTHVCFAGIVKRPNFSAMRPDFKMARRLPGIIRAGREGDDALLRHSIGLFEAEGFKVVSPQEICTELVLRDGPAGQLGLSNTHRDDALKACEMAAQIGALDIGQAAVVARGVVLAVEAQEGTDAMLDRVAGLPAPLRGTQEERAGVLAKLIKPNQDIRVDLPTIGPQTVRLAAQAGLAGIVAESGGAFIIDREETVQLADSLGLFLIGLPPKTDKNPPATGHDPAL